MIAATWVSVRSRSQVLLPGMIASTVVAAAASFLSEHYSAPVMLFALLLGMAMNFLAADGPCREGIEFTARTILRIGVALLGMRITFDQVASLGWGPIILVIGIVTATICVSVVLARALGFQSLFGVLTGGATAICGASAAMALSAAMPAHPAKERATLFTVVGVSALSTMAMIAYPMVVQWFGLGDVEAGIFLGGTIHDVAQVVGAGYSISHEAGDTATIVKLMRIAMLLPVILCVVMIARARGAQDGGKRPPLLPLFAVVFVLLAAVNSTGWVPPTVQQFGSDLSRWCLVIAISALGMKTQLKELAKVGFKPILLMLIETTVLAAMVLAVLYFS
ncbi:YeiH family protein [Microbulbifer sp. HZ11]|uniref:YeiH family protein n=1 Tax=Microbulbifer sp. HZ11 TaxID=1453501 RepID=UPI0005BE34A6|nr:putative sulfate exporter family transporter [Microbulbifer sp. HZ11]